MILALSEQGKHRQVPLREFQSTLRQAGRHASMPKSKHDTDGLLGQDVAMQQVKIDYKNLTDIIARKRFYTLRDVHFQ